MHRVGQARVDSQVSALHKRMFPFIKIRSKREGQSLGGKIFSVLHNLDSAYYDKSIEDNLVDNWMHETSAI